MRPKRRQTCVAGPTCNVRYRGVNESRTAYTCHPDPLLLSRMDSQESSRLTAPLACRVAEDTDSRQIADAIGAMWTDIESALQPVLGRRGVAALFKRTLHRTASRYIWLEPAKVAGDDAVCSLAELKALFSAQPPAKATEAGSVLFMNFRELLTSLIGPQLSEQLLKAAWSPSSSAPAAQDPKP